MITQTPLNFVNVFVFTDNLPVKPVQASSRDFGFDFDEEEIGMEWLASLPVNVSSQAIDEIDADEFEQVFPCFLS